MYDHGNNLDADILPPERPGRDEPGAGPVTDRALDLAILDVNETLFSLEPLARRMTEVGLDGRLELWFARVLRDGIAAAAAGRLVTFPDLARHHLLALFDESGREAPDAAVGHVLGGFDDVRAHPDVEPGLRRLQRAGVTIVPLTNGSADLTRAFLARCGLEDLVDDVHDVTAVGSWKPAPEPYRFVLARHDVPPARAALIAVHPWDVFGAQSAGLVGAWLDRNADRYPAPFGAPDVQAGDLPLLVARLLADDGPGT